jgi:hypothetical protein
MLSPAIEMFFKEICIYVVIFRIFCDMAWPKTFCCPTARPHQSQRSDLILTDSLFPPFCIRKKFRFCIVAEKKCMLSPAIEMFFKEICIYVPHDGEQNLCVPH